MTDLKLKTIDGVTALITKIASASAKKGGEKAETKEQGSALEAIVCLIEQHGGYDAGISRAMDTVRKAYNMPKKTQTDKESLK